MSEGTIRAAGGVLWRNAADADGPAAIEVAIIHRQRYDDWSLPKGKLAAGEREVDGAIREVLEETGYHVRLGRSLGETRYQKVDSGAAREKVVRWWAMEAASGGFGPTREVDELRWLTLGEAHDALTRDHGPGGARPLRARLGDRPDGAPGPQRQRHQPQRMGG